jgi:hypothetical protein
MQTINGCSASSQAAQAQHSTLGSLLVGNHWWHCSQAIEMIAILGRHAASQQ